MLVCFLLLAVIANATRTRSLAAALEEVDSEVANAVREAMNDAPTNSSADLPLNSLDIKSNAFQATEGKKEKQPRHVVLAFLNIAYEAIQRGVAAIRDLQAQIKAYATNMKIERSNMDNWMKNQENAALRRIEAERKKISTMMNEINHLQHVYQDALGKDRSYEQQSNFLVSERQLQTTPPLMPAVAAAAMSEQQYKQATENLKLYRLKAQSIIRQTTQAISTREHLANLASAWVKDSQIALKNWIAEQKAVVARRVAANQKHFAALNQRLANVRTIASDATTRHGEFLATLRRLDIEKQIASLKQTEAQNAKSVGATAYDVSKMAAFRASLTLEIKSLTATLAKMPGGDAVAAPPAAWGVLAGFQAPQLSSPSPSERVAVYTSGTSLSAPLTVNTPPQPQFIDNFAPQSLLDQPPIPVDAPATAPAAAPPAPAPATPAAAAAVKEAKFRALEEPRMPDLPPAPSVDITQLGD